MVARSVSAAKHVESLHGRVHNISSPSAACILTSHSNFTFSHLFTALATDTMCPPKGGSKEKTSPLLIKIAAGAFTGKVCSRFAVGLVLWLVLWCFMQLYYVVPFLVPQVSTAFGFLCWKPLDCFILWKAFAFQLSRCHRLLAGQPIWPAEGSHARRRYQPSSNVRNFAE